MEILESENKRLRVYEKDINDNEEVEVLCVDENEVQYLIINNKRLKQATIRLNKELTRLRAERTEANNATIKDNKLEIKMWRKLLGRERSLKIKLEKQINQDLLQGNKIAFM